MTTRYYIVSGLLILFFQLSCATSQKNLNPSPREPQQVAVTQIFFPAYKTFESFVAEPDEAIRSQEAATMLDRQRDFYFIAQDMLTAFDAELDKLYYLKQQNVTLAASDFEKFNQLNFQMRIAREFSEKNLHELLGIYDKALPQANDPAADFHKASDLLVNNVNAWLKTGSKKGDGPAISTMAQHLEDVNFQVKKELINNGKSITNIPSYKNYFKNQMPNLHTDISRLDSALQSTIGKEWLLFQAERSLDSETEIKGWTEETRTPQALDVLYPNAGGFGQVTGNRFPASTWAITLDDGPHPTYTPEMFKVLTDAQMPATFFWLSQNLRLYPQLSAQAHQLGFNRGSHSYTHANLPKLSQTELNHEINDACDEFERIIGAAPTFFRCPYGACGPSGSTIRQMIAARNALHIFWNVDSLDWQDKNPQTVFERARKQMELRDHGIVLFHDVHPQSVAALRLLTTYIKQKGFKVRPLPEIISEVREKPYASP